MKHTWAAEAMEKPSLLTHTRVHTHQTNEQNNINETAERRLPTGPETCRSWAIDHKLVALARADGLPQTWFLLQLGPQTCPQMSFGWGRSSPASRSGIVQNQTVAKQTVVVEACKLGLGIRT